MKITSMFLVTLALSATQALASEIPTPDIDCRAIKSELNLETYTSVVKTYKDLETICTQQSEITTNFKKSEDHPTKLDQATQEALELVFQNSITNEEQKDVAITDAEKTEFFKKILPFTSSAEEHLCKNVLPGYKEALKEIADQSPKTGTRKMDLGAMFQKIISVISKVSISDIPDLQNKLDALEQPRSKVVFQSLLESADETFSSLKMALEGAASDYEDGIKELKSCHDSSVREI